jgi:hypothetical protein
VSTSDTPEHFFKRPQAGTAMAIDPQTNRTTRKIAISTLDHTIRWPPLLGGKVGWPKGVPRIAKLDDDARKPSSPAASRTLSAKPTLISLPRVLVAYGVGGRVVGDAHKDVERLR